MTGKVCAAHDNASAMARQSFSMPPYSADSHPGVPLVLPSNRHCRVLGRRPQSSGLGPNLEVVAMTTTTPDPSSILAPATDPLFTVGERQALAGSCPATAA
jgi:hypothetical protein